MERNADKRIRMTKRLLAEELVRSASGRELDDISVSELCENAGVSRVTFYKYYKSIRELMEETAANALAQVTPQDGSEQKMEQVIRHLLLNRPLYLMLIEKGYYEQSLRSYLAGLLVSKNRDGPQSAILDAQMQYAVSGICGLLHYCLQEEPDITVRQLTDIILRFHESWTHDVQETGKL